MPSVANGRFSPFQAGFERREGVTTASHLGRSGFRNVTSFDGFIRRSLPSASFCTASLSRKVAIRGNLAEIPSAGTQEKQTVPPRFPDALSNCRRIVEMTPGTVGIRACDSAESLSVSLRTRVLFIPASLTCTQFLTKIVCVIVPWLDRQLVSSASVHSRSVVVE